MFLLETLREKCSLAFSSCLHSLASGCMTPPSASNTSPLMLTSPSLFDKDTCDYIAPPHLIRDNLPASRSLTPDALCHPTLRFHVGVTPVFVCKPVSSLNSGHALPACPGTSLAPFLALSSLNSKLRCRGREKERKRGRWKGNSVCGQYSGLVWFDNIPTLVMFPQCKLHRVQRLTLEKRTGEGYIWVCFYMHCSF